MHRAKKVQNSNKISMIVAVAVMATSSFDVFMSFEIAGFHFRIVQFIAVGLYLLAFWKIWGTKKIKEMYAWKPLTICFFALILATFNSSWYIKNIAYDLWMISLIMIVWSFVQLFDNENDVHILLKAYLVTFDIMAVFGVIQFLLAFFKVKNLFLRQWLIYDVIPRINGFCYEPSYYATYMVMGWAFCAGLLSEGVYKWNGISIWFSFVLLSFSLVLSSSRMIYICFVFWTIYYVITWVIMRIKEKTVTKKALVALLLQMSVWIIVGLYLMFVAIVGVIVPENEQSVQDTAVEDNMSTMDIMLQGLGSQGNARNANERLLAWKYTLKVFLKSPVLGCGLGAVEDEGKLIAEPNANPLGSGNVFFEILASGGIVAGLAAIAYVFCLLRPGWTQTSLYTDSFSITRSLGYGLIGTLILMMFNATILRVYLWVHLALFTTWNGVYRERKLDKNENS